MLQQSMPDPVKDDAITVIAISSLAYIIQDVAHEGLGHAVVAWASGARHITISTVALQSDIGTRWISASGTLVNLVLAAIFWFLLRALPHVKPATRYFFVLNLAAALFTGTGYFFYSGVANFGDWAAVIAGMEPHWAWRVGLVVLGTITYYASMLLVARQFQSFQGAGGSRIRRLSWTPYITEGVVSLLAGLLNPAGLFYVLVSALPSTLGANAGLVCLPFVMQGWGARKTEPVGPIGRSVAWIVAGGVASGLFILVLGRGLTFSR